jgi:hypothetical protein
VERGGLTLTLAALGSAVEVLAGVLCDPDVDPGLLVEFLDVLLESLNSDVVPVNRVEAVDISTGSDQLERRTHSGLQSEAELPYCVHSVWMS